MFTDVLLRIFNPDILFVFVSLSASDLLSKQASGSLFQTTCFSLLLSNVKTVCKGKSYGSYLSNQKNMAASSENMSFFLPFKVF